MVATQGESRVDDDLHRALSVRSTQEHTSLQVFVDTCAMESPAGKRIRDGVLGLV